MFSIQANHSAGMRIRSSVVFVFTHGAIMMQYWRIDYRDVEGAEDLQLFSDIAKKLLRGKCPAHAINDKVYTETLAVTCDYCHKEKEIGHHIFALIEVEKQVLEFELRWHFQEESKCYLDDNGDCFYTGESSRFTDEQLTPDEYQKQSSKYAHQEL
jgi:hypothetical protein